MERRKAIKISVAAIAAGGVGAITLTTAFKPDIKPAVAPEKLGWTQRDSPWTYLPLDPAVTAALAYKGTAQKLIGILCVDVTVYQGMLPCKEIVSTKGRV